MVNLGFIMPEDRKLQRNAVQAAAISALKRPAGSSTSPALEIKKHHLDDGVLTNLIRPIAGPST